DEAIENNLTISGKAVVYAPQARLGKISEKKGFPAIVNTATVQVGTIETALIGSSATVEAEHLGAKPHILFDSASNIILKRGIGIAALHQCLQDQSITFAVNYIPYLNGITSSCMIFAESSQQEIQQTKPDSVFSRHHAYAIPLEIKERAQRAGGEEFIPMQNTTVMLPRRGGYTAFMWNEKQYVIVATPSLGNPHKMGYLLYERVDNELEPQFGFVYPRSFATKAEKREMFASLAVESSEHPSQESYVQSFTEDAAQRREERQHTEPQIDYDLLGDSIKIEKSGEAFVLRWAAEAVRTFDPERVLQGVFSGSYELNEGQLIAHVHYPRLDDENILTLTMNEDQLNTFINHCCSQVGMERSSFVAILKNLAIIQRLTPHSADTQNGINHLSDYLLSKADPSSSSVAIVNGVGGLEKAREITNLRSAHQFLALMHISPPQQRGDAWAILIALQTLDRKLNTRQTDTASTTSFQQNIHATIAVLASQFGITLSDEGF
ncbi:MAG: hypothetical protein V1922_02200, partial [bacterium]